MGEADLVSEEREVEHKKKHWRRKKERHEEER